MAYDWNLYERGIARNHKTAQNDTNDRKSRLDVAPGSTNANHLDPQAAQDPRGNATNMKVLAIILLAATLIGAALLVSGCYTPPRNTVWIDTNADGLPDMLAIDNNGDGIADLDANTRPYLIAPPAGAQPPEAVDTSIATVLTLVGGLLGAPLLVTAGAVWKQTGLSKVIANIITSLDTARASLAANGNAPALKQLDTIMASVQTANTTAVIAKTNPTRHMTTTPAPLPPTPAQQPTT